MEAESIYFNCNSNHSQISTKSKVPAKFPQSLSRHSQFLCIHSLRSITKFSVDRKSEHYAVLGSFMRVSCVPTKDSQLPQILKHTIYL